MKDIAWLSLIGGVLAALLVAGIKGCGGPGGNPPSSIAATYTRPGTHINIVFTTAQGFYGHPGVGQDFSSTQISLMEMALDTLTDKQIIQSGLTTVIPAPQAFHDEGKWGPTILLDPNDPNLITHFLTFIGFPPSSFSTSSQKGSASHTDTLATINPNLSLQTRGYQVISSQSPSDYIPMTSPAGLQSVLDDSNMVKNDKGQNKLPTLQDQVRPHGDVQIIPPTSSQ